MSQEGGQPTIAVCHRPVPGVGSLPGSNLVHSPLSSNVLQVQTRSTEERPATLSCVIERWR
jgi:hypothetical protein